MYNKIKTEVQIFSVLFLVTAALISLSVLVDLNARPLVASAQEPQEPPATPTSSFNKATLVATKLQQGPGKTKIPVLVVNKVPSATTINAGQRITFTISIINLGDVAANNVIFYDDYPAQMQNLAPYDFSVPATLLSTPGKPTWILSDPIPPSGGIVLITVTGILTSQPNVTVTNTAVVTPTNASPASGSTQVGIRGANPTGPVYLPVIRRDPTPTPSPTPSIILAYSEDFSSDTAWVEFTDKGCTTDNRDGQYWVDIDGTDDPFNNECLPPARNENKPERPYRTYGEFEVAVYHSEGQSNASMGIFINGQGAENHYLFRIWPNENCSSGGDWQLLRRRSGSSNILLSRDCDPAVKRGYGSDNTNIVKMTHTSDRTIKVFVNGTQVGTFRDSETNHLTGEATGVYVRPTNINIRVKFDNFKVYRLP